MNAKKSYIGSIVVLLLFAVFMVSILFVLLTGADVFRKLADRDRDSYNQRTAVQYMTTRIRHADQMGSVSTRGFAGQKALVITEEYDGVEYETLVYCYDGYLRELFSEAGLEQEPEYGELILPVESIQIKKQESLLQAKLQMADGEQETIVLHLRSGKEAAA